MSDDDIEDEGGFWRNFHSAATLLRNQSYADDDEMDETATRRANRFVVQQGSFTTSWLTPTHTHPDTTRSYPSDFAVDSEDKSGNFSTRSAPSTSDSSMASLVPGASMDLQRVSGRPDVDVVHEIDLGRLQEVLPPMYNPRWRDDHSTIGVHAF
jgi:hypothetical protein